MKIYEAEKHNLVQGYNFWNERVEMVEQKYSIFWRTTEAKTEAEVNEIKYYAFLNILTRNLRIIDEWNGHCLTGTCNSFNDLFTIAINVQRAQQLHKCLLHV